MEFYARANDDRVAEEAEYNECGAVRSFGKAITKRLQLWVKLWGLEGSLPG